MTASEMKKISRRIRRRRRLRLLLAALLLLIAALLLVERNFRPLVFALAQARSSAMATKVLSSAVAEALGVYVDAEGGIVGSRAPLALLTNDMGWRVRAAAVAVGRSRAEAIISVCAQRAHRLLVTDEGAALRMMELLRV